MPSEFVICVYRPKTKGVRENTREILDILDSGGYLAGRRHLVTESEKGGAILEFLEWKSRDAAEQAHDDPNMLTIWERMSAMADTITLRDLAEAADTFLPTSSPYR